MIHEYNESLCLVSKIGWETLEVENIICEAKY